MSNINSQTFRKKALCSVIATLLTPASVFAQQAQEEEVIVTGIRSALANAIVEKRAADSLVEVIQADDIGKLPDQNLAEVLENVTGIQINRNAGVGTNVQIRGTSANRVEINGVATLSPGNERGGISFDDLPAALIGSVEVIKAPTAKTIEGSVGGTINLRTLRGLDLSDRVISVRAQLENSDLADSTSPRISGTFGDNWSTDAGDFGFVIAANYSEQEVASFDPRFDRDRENLPGSNDSSEDFPFLRTQFLNQTISSFAYETKNLTTSFEFAPNDDLKFYFDATLNDQERAQQSSEIQFSGTGNIGVINATNNTAFETINLGTIDGPNGPLVLGEVQAVLQGVLNVGVDDVPERPRAINTNFRTVSGTGSRVTDSKVIAFGTQWQREKLQLDFEASYSVSDSDTPNLSTRIDFINPRGPQPEFGQSADNGVPAEFDASNRTLQFGIAQGLPETPTSAELLDPANYALNQVQLGQDSAKNKDTAFRIDAEYDLSEDMPFLVAVKGGIRLNETSSVNDDKNDVFAYTNATTRFYRPRGDLFADVLVPGRNNYNAADGRRLFVADYLVVDPGLSFNNPDAVIASLNRALEQNNDEQIAAGNITEPYPTLTEPSDKLGAFFDISEETTALYIQADFEFDAGFPIRGNFGLRSVDTDLTILGNSLLNGVVESTREERSYSFVLPRFNIVAEVSDDLVIRSGISKDINRPEFQNLSTSVTFGTGEDSPVNRGNADLVPEKVTSYDLSAEYYISDAAFVSAGVFHKKRTDIINNETSFPEETSRPGGGQPLRDIDPPCEGGGIYNPVAVRNVFSDVQGQGICVPLASPFNVGGNSTQTGIELAFQYDLSEFEDALGWASGFGFIGNYTYQESDTSSDNFINANGDGNALNDLLGRTDGQIDEDTGERVYTTPTLDDDVVLERRELRLLSKNAYNATIFYEKYDLSIRARYTWRSAFISDQRSISFGLQRIIDDRAQLNLSASYQINDYIAISLDGVNLLREDRTQWCVNEGALLCSQGLTDRRIIAGVSAKF